MNTVRFFILAALLLTPLGAPCASADATPRQVQDFDADWRFQKDPKDLLKDAAAAADFDDHAWPLVRLPHDWAISGPFEPQGSSGTGKLPWQGVGWYRKAFSLAAGAAAKQVYLDFEGVMASPEVYINGKRAGGWDYGYLGFRVDASPFINFGKANVVAVKVDTRAHGSRWYPGAGIYRKVTLTLCAPVHLVHEATFVTTPAVNERQAEVHVATAVTNATDRSADCAIVLELVDPAGQVVATQTDSLTVPAHGSAPAAHRFALEAPRLWDMAAPQLYQARISVTCKGHADAETTRFGIRSFAFSAEDGFHLNGRRVPLNGVDLHADLGLLGMAFNRSAMRRELEIMKDMGFNALRTSHNPPAPEVLDLCDEMGIFVWDECFDKWEGTAGRRHDQQLEDYISRNLRQFVRRDRNHPCVFVWSIGNEIGPAKPGDPRDPGMTQARCTLFREVIRELDTTRLVGIGCCHGNAVGMGIFDKLDITGWNYQGQYSNIKRKYPDKPVLYSESASALSSYGYYAAPPPQHKTDFSRDLEVCSYDHNAAPWSDIPDLEFARMERDRYCAGEFVWTGFDYLGEPTPFDGGTVFKGEYPKEQTARSSYFGIVDLSGVPKDRFFLYRSHWNTNAVTLHILPHWNWPDKVGQSVPVYVYTSGDSAELFLNGRSLGRRTKGQPLPKPVNFAAGKVATASTCETKNGQTKGAALALDGDDTTRWCASGPEKAQWWQVDLGAPTAFRFLAANFEAEAKNYQYEVLASDDAAKWTPLFGRKLGATAPALLDKPTTCRYIRIAFTDLTAGHYASIRELILSNARPTNPYYDVCDNYRLRWLDVTYAPGELKAVAYQRGEKIAETVMQTAGQPVAVKLTPEKAALPADGESLAFVQVDVVDARGVRDPRATNQIHFALTGPGELVAVGNGNPRGYDVFTATAQHPLYFGKAVAVVRRKAGQSGPVTLTASADGLTAATLGFQ